MSRQTQRLKRVIAGWQQRGHWPHALLLSGVPTPVMLSLAMQVAKTRLCEEQSACSNCASCSWFDSGNHIDFHLLASSPTAEEFDLRIESENTSVRRLIRKDDVTALLGRLALHAHVQNGWRVVLLVHPEELHTAAANALLKTLEEPGERTFFLLISEQPRAVLETIISRCQQLSLPPLEHQKLVKELRESGEDSKVVGALAALQARGINLSSEDLLAWRVDAMEWLSACAAGEDHRRLLALDRMNKASDADRMMGLALSLTLDLSRLQNGMQQSALTHGDLADELGALAGAGPWLDLAQTIADARPALARNVRLHTLLIGASL